MHIFKYMFVILVLNAPMVVGAAEFYSYEIGVPVRFIEGCEADFDRDSKQDIALLFENAKNTILVALLKRGDGYKSYTLFQSDSRQLHLACKYGAKLIGSNAGKGKGVSKKVNINGEYLLVFQPESSRVAFYWNGTHFEQIWVAD